VKIIRGLKQIFKWDHDEIDEDKWTGRFRFTEGAVQINVASIKLLVANLEKCWPGRVWLVGGVARHILLSATGVIDEPLTAKDTDFIVEGVTQDEINDALNTLLTGNEFATRKKNRFGGLKLGLLTEDGPSELVDVFALNSVANYLSRCPTYKQGIAINCSNGCVLTTAEFMSNPSSEGAPNRSVTTFTNKLS